MEYPFLYTFNPTINWQQGALPGDLHIQTLHYKYWFCDIFDIQKKAIERTGRPKEGEAIYMRWSIAQDWARKAAKNQVQLTEQMVLEEYQRHAKVFLEKESLRFPPKCKEDMTIPLKADTPGMINCKVYLLTREERGLLEKIPG